MWSRSPLVVKLLRSSPVFCLRSSCVPRWVYGCASYTTMVDRLNLEQRIEQSIAKQETQPVLTLFRLLTLQKYVKPELHESVIAFVATSHGPNEVIDVFRAVPAFAPSTILFVLQYLIEQKKDLPRALSLVSTLKVEGYRPTKEVHWILFRHLCFQEDLENATSYWNDHKDIHTMVQFVIPYARLCLAQGMQDEVVVLLESVQGESVLLDQFKLEINVLMLQVDTVLEELQKMESPSTFTLTFTLKHFLKHNNKEAFHSVLDLLLAPRYVVPIQVLHSVTRYLLNSSTESSEKEIMYLFDWADKKGVPLDLRYAKLVAMHFLKNGKFEEFHSIKNSFYTHAPEEWDENVALQNTYCLKAIQQNMRQKKIEEKN